ncbi:unnamed protein product, partial [Mesorhabditis belari]|uniref:5'-nucleotidase n=1 Tax=Mesorhabditis belari TaxID=2138241 RepID=A0AAF3ENY4_9BILA
MPGSFEKLFAESHVKCRDREDVEKKLEKILTDGVNELLVLSDFDYTLSRAFDENGDRCWSTLGVFDILADEVQPGLSKEILQLWEYYHPIEFDPHMSLDEKIPHMEDWWSKAHELICSAPFTKKILEGFVAKSNVRLREGGEEWIRHLEHSGVPLVVFSAGSGDVIHMHLNNKLGKIPDNVHIIANMIEYDGKGHLEKFKEPLIHVFNKNATVIQKNGPFWDAHSTRKHLLLMGDSLGDIHMDVGEDHQGVTLKIGFLNKYSDDLYKRFLQGFDIVVLNDQTMKIPDMITKMVTSSKNEKAAV